MVTNKGFLLLLAPMPGALFIIFIIISFSHTMVYRGYNDMFEISLLTYFLTPWELIQLAGLLSVLGAWQSCSSNLGQSCSRWAILFLLGNLVGWNVLTKVQWFQNFDNEDTKLHLFSKVWISHPSIAAVLMKIEVGSSRSKLSYCLESF